MKSEKNWTVGPRLNADAKPNPMNTDTQTKNYRNYYRTALVVADSEDFKRGTYVAVRYHGKGISGTHWFQAATRKDATIWTVIPEQHLTDFVL